MFWRTLGVGEREREIKKCQSPASNCHLTHLTIGCQCNLNPITWLSSLFFCLSDCRHSLWQNKAVENMPDYFLKTLQLRRGNGRKRTTDHLKEMLFAWFYLCWIAVYNVARCCINKAFIYTIVIFCHHFLQLFYFPSRLDVCCRGHPQRHYF